MLQVRKLWLKKCVIGGVRWWCSFCRLKQPAKRTPPKTPRTKSSNTQRTENKTTDVVIHQHSSKLLKMDILMSETCWARNKWNKIAIDIKLVFHSSTIAMMHSPINISIIHSLFNFYLYKVIPWLRTFVVGFSPRRHGFNFESLRRYLRVFWASWCCEKYFIEQCGISRSLSLHHCNIIRFYIHESVHCEPNLIIIQKYATVFSLLYFCRQLYMFRVLTPIITSSYNCNHSSCHCSTRSTTIRSRCWVGTDSRVSYGRYYLPYDTHESVPSQQRERMVVDPVNQYQKL